MDIVAVCEDLVKYKFDLVQSTVHYFLINSPAERRANLFIFSVAGYLSSRFTAPSSSCERR